MWSIQTYNCQVRSATDGSLAFIGQALAINAGVCPSGSTYDSSTGLCTTPPPVCTAGQLSSSDGCHYTPATASADKGIGKPSCTACPCPIEDGNPINHGNGNKRQLESDYLSAAGYGMQLRRTYNGNSTRNGRYGARWSGNYERIVLTNSAYPNNAGIQRDDGKILTFTLTNGVYRPDADVTDNLTRQTDGAGNTIGWQYRVATDQSLESYDSNGRLLSITSREGWVQTLTYSDTSTPVTIAPQPGLMLRVADQFGRQLNFTYDSSSRLIQMTDPTGKTVSYSYDSNNNLSSVTYQDGKTRTYVYNEPAYTDGANLPTALTGIVDENNVRFATFNYDSSGRGISTEHAGGVEKYSIGYTQPGSQSTVTDPLGTVRTYSFQTLLNTIRSTGQNQPGGAGCGAASSTVAYDANGNVATRTDFNGTVTTYSYDLTRNLEASRVEASGTPLARTITTAWHATYSLPLQIAEPKLLTTYSYDTSGNLLSKTVQATSDTTGAQGLSPALVGTARTWSYTYNAVGQVLTATGPRADVADKTTYTYDSSGNLSTITNAVGQVTILWNYDANGRAGLITDANGATTALTYSPRGWLTGKTVTSGGSIETTTYGYDGVGQLTLVTLPNTSTVSYTYDPAHRLTNIADSLGNSIAYTLDNMGNRISEQVKDPSGALARQTSRVIDALNRIQQITAAVQ
ncbi:DUF6531 domain-containing protein [Collimonas sp. NPDC087041]|uniref:DUF6531 domain-containing protein n=1 Tax=Collimonas sp. NPDC087041 TaxID=3363960 RepID=UPI003830AFDF